MTATYQANWPRPTTPEEEAELSAAALAGSIDARNRLASAHLPLAMKFARRMAEGLGMDVGDAFGAAQLGLIRAAEMFDASRDTRFTTYAGWWVRQAIQRHSVEAVGAARITHHQAWMSRAGRVAAGGSSAEYAGRAAACHRRPMSLDWAPDDGGSWAEKLPDTREPDRDDDDRLAAIRADVAELLAVLDAQERLAVERYFGLVDAPEQLPAIGRRLGVTKDRARTIKNMGLLRMAKMAGATEAVAC